MNDIQMMIKNEKCPTCGAKIIERKLNQHHTNGYWNEFIKFHCGLILHFIPNYMKIKTEGECENDPVVIEREKNKRILIRELTKVTNNINVSDALKEKILAHIQIILS